MFGLQRNFDAKTVFFCLQWNLDTKTFPIFGEDLSFLAPDPRNIPPPQLQISGYVTALACVFVLKVLVFECFVDLHVLCCSDWYNY